jgi:ATP-dependent Clp protease ATP-binding subunit ClpB
VIALDIGSMVAGLEVPRRVRGAVQGGAEGDRRLRGRVITFIDELHTIVGAGGAEGAVDAGNMIKPMLARGELRLIGATTLDEYRKYIEKDAALERGSSRSTWASRRSRTRSRSCAASRSATRCTTVCASRTRRSSPRPCSPTATSRAVSFPDKAIDLVDEAASRLRIEIDSMPFEIDVGRAAHPQLEIERAALREGDRRREQARLETLEAS